jgi:CheY-like chemotaxis protein
MASQKILIVDDSRTIRTHVREMLPKGNLEVLEASDGVEGLELISREYPNLVLLDFFMPRMNGWEVVQKIQSNPRLKRIPIVMMSARREDVEKTVPELFDYFEFLNKPFDQPTLMQAIKSAMTKAKSRQYPALPEPAQDSQAAPTGEMSTLSAPIATPTDSTAAIQTLKAEVQALQRENAQLKTEFELLKRQVSQILTFIRQKVK